MFLLTFIVLASQENFCEEWLILYSFNTVNLEEYAQADEFFEQVIPLSTLLDRLQWKLSLQGTNEWDDITCTGPYFV